MGYIRRYGPFRVILIYVGSENLNLSKLTMVAVKTYGVIRFIFKLMSEWMEFRSWIDEKDAEFLYPKDCQKKETFQPLTVAAAIGSI